MKICPTTLRIALFAAMAAVAGCMDFGDIAKAVDDLRCDRRVGVIVNARVGKGETRTVDGIVYAETREFHTWSELGKYLEYLAGREVDEVIFEGEVTGHGYLGEFKDIVYVWEKKMPKNVKRTWRLSERDVSGKYHPSTFWQRTTGEEWSDSLLADATREGLGSRVSGLGEEATNLETSPQPEPRDPNPETRPFALYVLSYYGDKVKTERIGYVTRGDAWTPKSRHKTTLETIEEF